MQRKRLLFLKFANDYDAAAQQIGGVSEFYNYECVLHNYDGLDELKTFLNGQENAFDILYVGAHGCAKGIAKDCDGSEFVRWADLADILCGSAGLAERTTIYLGSCDAGSKRTPLIMMRRCLKVHAVAGMPCKLNDRVAALGFHAFLHNSELHKAATGIKQAVSGAVGNEFSLYSRYDLDSEMAALDSAPYLPAAFFGSAELSGISLGRPFSEECPILFSHPRGGAPIEVPISEPANANMSDNQVLPVVNR